MESPNGAQRSLEGRQKRSPIQNKSRTNSPSKDAVVAQLNKNLQIFGRSNGPSPKLHLPPSPFRDNHDLKQSSPSLPGNMPSYSPDSPNSLECIIHYEPHLQNEADIQNYRRQPETSYLYTITDKVSARKNLTANFNDVKNGQNIEEMRQNNNEGEIPSPSQYKNLTRLQTLNLIKTLTQNLKDVNISKGGTLPTAGTNATAFSPQQSDPDVKKEPNDVVYHHKWLESQQRKKKSKKKSSDEVSVTSESTSITSMEVANIFTEKHSSKAGSRTKFQSISQRRKNHSRASSSRSKDGRESVSKLQRKSHKLPQLSLENFVEQSFASFLSERDAGKDSEAPPVPRDSGITVSLEKNDEKTHELLSGDVTPTSQPSSGDVTPTAQVTCISLFKLLKTHSLHRIALDKTGEEKFGIRVIYTQFKSQDTERLNNSRPASNSSSDCENYWCNLEILNNPADDFILHIRHLDESGVAKSLGTVLEGDYIAEINNQFVLGLDEDFVNDLIEEADRLELLVARPRPVMYSRACTPVEFLPEGVTEHSSPENKDTLLIVVQNYERLRRKLHQKDEIIGKLKNFLSTNVSEDSGFGLELYDSFTEL